MLSVKMGDAFSIKVKVKAYMRCMNTWGGLVRIFGC